MSDTDSTIKANSLNVLSRISQAQQTYGRSQDEICLIAVSKTHPFDAILAAYNSGLRHFGENYLQEAVQKITKLDELGQCRDICWHFIGPAQSNKSKALAEHFHWVHSVDRFKLAQKLNQYRPEPWPPLNVLIQVNIAQESSKSGVALTEIEPLARQIMDLPRLRLRGLMTIGQRDATDEQTEESFKQLNKTLHELQHQFENHPLRPHLDTLSMGMSNDFPLAIKHGATQVRVGSQIFGARKQSSFL